MKALTLSGWGQPEHALSALLPGTEPLDYARHDNLEDALKEIAARGEGADVVVGWSLGGQLAVRAIAAKLFRPQALVLIAAPFQFVESPELKLGMKRDQYEKFSGNYEKNPRRTLTKAWELLTKGDTHPEQIRSAMAGFDFEACLAKDWLGWLRRLDGFSCKDLDFTDFPPTLILHGNGDAVVGVEQSAVFETAIPGSRKIIVNGAGHAPHWHSTESVQHTIAVFLDVR